MKTLLLMRHAKSSWKDHKVEDHERPLNKKGEKDAPRMGKLLKEKELIPQVILSSTAVRAQKTAEALVEKCGFSEKVEYLDALYLAEPPAYLEELHRLDDNIDRAMIIGHNPGLEGLLQILSGEVQSLPTSAIAHISIPIMEWKALEGEVKGELVEIWRPRDLKH